MQEIDAKCYRIAQELFTSIVYRTPVLTGALKNNWYPKVGSSFSTEKNPNSKDANGMASLTRISSLVGAKEFLAKDGSFTLTNNLDYALLAEVHGWMPPQWTGKVKAYRMVALSLMEVAARNR